MDKPLDELYFEWLYSQVGDPRVNTPTRTYWRMLKVLYTTEFAWFIPNDDNRIADGKELRPEFVDDFGIRHVDPGWMNLGCSMLELLIALSRRLAFEAEGEPSGWFWELIENIGLGGFTDERMGYRYTETMVADILERVIWRRYDFDGNGGLFPLRHTEYDQTKLEIWHQMNAYVLERT